MTRSLKLCTAVLVLCGLFAGTAFAKAVPAKGARLDPSYGWHGSYAVATTEPKPPIGQPVHLALTTDGEAYVVQGRMILAFAPDGKPDHAFGKNGRMRVDPGPGEVTQVASVAVDPEGHVLVAGTYVPFPGFTNPVIKGAPEYPSHEGVTEAFVARYLPDGSLDYTFGINGVTITSFGMPRPTDRPYGGKQPDAEYERPSVAVTQMAVDSQSRPVIAGTYVESMEFCGYGNSFTRSFVARLTRSGVPDLSFGGSGYTKIAGRVTGKVALGPGDEVAAVSTKSNECAEHSPPAGPYWSTSVLTEAGEGSPTLDPARPMVGGGKDLAIDPQGRILITERAGPVGPFGEREGGLKVVRLLPDGDLDTNFGYDGAANLKRFDIAASSITVDGKGRTVVAFGSEEPKLLRISATGKVEASFAKKAILHATIERVASMEPEAVAIDPKGRIVVAGTARGGVLKTGFGVGIVRFLPGE